MSCCDSNRRLSSGKSPACSPAVGGGSWQARAAATRHHRCPPGFCCWRPSLSAPHSLSAARERLRPAGKCGTNMEIKKGRKEGSSSSHSRNRLSLPSRPSLPSRRQRQRQQQSLPAAAEAAAAAPAALAGTARAGVGSCQRPTWCLRDRFKSKLALAAETNQLPTAAHLVPEAFRESPRRQLRCRDSELMLRTPRMGKASSRPSCARIVYAAQLNQVKMIQKQDRRLRGSCNATASLPSSVAATSCAAAPPRPATRPQQGPFDPNLP